MLIKILKTITYPIDLMINTLTKHEIEDYIWSTLTRYECKKKGGYCKATLHCLDGDRQVYGYYYCGWLLDDDNILWKIEPVEFISKNFEKWVDK